ncbi:MAG: DUF1896 family protein [Agriterribacter sp.]
MEQAILNEFIKVLIKSYPDLLLEVQESGQVNAFIQGKLEAIQPVVESLRNAGQPKYIIEELALDHLISTVGPSRFDYILQVLEEDFAELYSDMQGSGVFTYEAIGILLKVAHVFDELAFNEGNKDDRLLRYAIIGAIQEFINTLKSEAVDGI